MSLHTQCHWATSVVAAAAAAEPTVAYKYLPHQLPQHKLMRCAHMLCLLLLLLVPCGFHRMHLYLTEAFWELSEPAMPGPPPPPPTHAVPNSCLDCSWSALCVRSCCCCCLLQAGCTMEDTGAWVNLKQDNNLLIVGLKELAVDTFSLVNRHTYFAHVFKGQEGWQVRIQLRWACTCAWDTFYVVV